ncbi:hypothetical protein BDA96_09G166600 [Sorghum bicolor]|uniref:PAR1 protein n=2 Tax=Sorghum bicolor TaxID=4558 RepID=A0A921QAD6_SORBI|nr:uncharacterized protein LOC8072525 [Sorghum bicolor]EES18328.1 hypothetical protein SORBI_3009G158700 [Sorghum bicolor]KAG0518327.1 hypothetical protein BDA96_09G166600 [Sorghum bicolor]|eukprot:XP_002439898.1 uncharacterized protein LOC8072525 [Sorghum bicolor]
MASSATFAILLVIAIAVQSARGGQLACEELPPDVCAFAVSSAGRRCVLERTPEGAHRCQTSAVSGARGLAGWVETDACVRACGVDRAALGLPVASAAAEDRRSFRALCSSACRDGCPNVVHLYATVAAAEGMSLPALCEAQNRAGNRRMMTGMAPLGAPVAAPEAAEAPCEE